MRRNMTNFRIFSPDENASNRLQDVYAASLKTWLAKILPEDADGTNIAPDGRVMEMLSEHTLEGRGRNASTTSVALSQQSRRRRVARQPRPWVRAIVDRV